MGVHTRFSKVLALALLLGSATVHAQSGPLLNAFDRDNISKAKQIQNDPESVLGSDFLDSYQAPNQALQSGKAEAAALMEQMRDTNPTVRNAQQKQDAKQSYPGINNLIFISLSLKGRALDDILELASSRADDSMLVLRGIPEGARINEAFTLLQGLVAGYDPLPNLVIDPNLFKEHEVESVPTLVRLAPANAGELGGRRMVARVEGLSDPSWVDQRLAQGEGGELGIRGPLTEIAEPDLIEVMKARVAQIDWEDKKNKAQKRFWDNQEFLWLPTATRSRTRQLDPSVLVTQDLTDGKGNLIAAEGTRINPLDTVPFTQAVVVFDPLDPVQVEILDTYLPILKQRDGVQRITLIATQLDADIGWDSYESVTDHFEAPVYLLTPDLVKRFQLEYIPSVITADDKQFAIEELTRAEVIHE